MFSLVIVYFFFNEAAATGVYTYGHTLCLHDDLPIDSILMLQQNFVAAAAQIDRLDPAAEGMKIARERQDDAGHACVMSNSFGVGGTNASLVFKRYDA